MAAVPSRTTIAFHDRQARRLTNRRAGGKIKQHVKAKEKHWLSDGPKLNESLFDTGGIEDVNIDLLDLNLLDTSEPRAAPKSFTQRLHLIRRASKNRLDLAVQTISDIAFDAA
jgi:hypothetical protein